MKNNLNPVAKSRVGAAVLCLLACPLAALLLLPLLARGPLPPAAEWLRSLNVTRSFLVDSTSALLSASLALILVRGRREIAASEEAEHELLLALPITMGDYLVGKTLYFAAQATVYALPLLYAGIPVMYSLVGLDSARAVIFAASIALAVAYVEALTTLASIARIKSGERPLAEAAGYAYLAASLLHTLAAGRISPLLVAPSLPAVSPLVDAFSRRVPTPQLAVELLVLLASLLAALSAVRLASRWAHPENVRPLAEIMRDVALPRRRSVTFAGASPEAAVRTAVLKLSLLYSRHSAALALGLVLAPTAALALRVWGPPLDALTLASFSVVFLVSEATIATAFAVQRDLSQLWLYRTAPLSLKPLAESLVYKVLLYYAEGFTLVALFRAAYDGNPAWLLLPVSALPVAALVALLLLTFLARVAARRRLVRYSSRGFYMVEDAVATAILGFSTALAVTVLVLHELAVRYASGPTWLLSFAAASTLVAALLVRIAEDILYRQLWYTDVA